MNNETNVIPAQVQQLDGAALGGEINTSYDDQPVRAVKRLYRCPKCGDGHIAWTGATLTSNPPWYPHHCAQCGSTSNLRDITGRIVYLYADPPNVTDHRADAQGESK